MPVVLRVGRFRVLVYMPPREHSPAHVHVRHAHGEIVIDLPVAGRQQSITRSDGMSDRDAAVAFRIVEQNSSFLIQCWRKYHG